MLFLCFWGCHAFWNDERCGQVLDINYSSADIERPVPDDEVVIVLGGDAMLGRGVASQFSHGSPHLWRNMEELLMDVDILAVNLETTISTATRKWPDKSFHFQADPIHAQATLESLPLPNAAKLYTSLANNHILDFGLDGLEDTLESLDAFGVDYAGAGENKKKAQQARIIEIGHTKIAFLSAANHCGCNDVCEWQAGEDQPGMWYINAEESIWQDALVAVQELRSQVHWIVFSMHWGPNYRAEGPEEWMKEMASELLEAGVDIIHGHSSHHIFPIASKDGRSILYGSGGFIDDYSEEEGYRNDLSYLAKIHLSPSKNQELEIIPMRIGHDTGHYLQALESSDPDYNLVLEYANGQME